MKKCMVPAVLFVLGIGMSMASAAQGVASGPAALALAGVVASHSPVLSSADRRTVARLFAGNTVSFPQRRQISVTAASIDCRISNVDIMSRACEIAFGDRKRSLKGREANELFAVITAAGIAPEGAAGSTLQKVAKLVCTIDPNEIQKKAGGGAECSFEAVQ
jgi:hypothetical protein